jgi:CDP-diglyceride synthetase
MNPTLIGVLVVGGMFIGMLLLLEIGRRLGERALAGDPAAAKSGSGVIEGAVFGLMALLIAFTFSGAATRFDTRRSLVVEEANNIGTAWLRLDLLPVTAQPPLREKFRQYMDARLATYDKLPDITAAMVEMARATALQNEIWKEAVAACRDSGSSPATMLLLPALNQMIDITTTRTVAARTHPPVVIYVMLVLLVLAGSLLAGYGMANGKARNWFHAFAFALIMSIAMYVILDFEFPRIGLIRLNAYDQVLMDMRQSMNP